MEINIFAELGKFFVCSRRLGQQLLCCVLKQDWRCSCHSYLTSQSGPPSDLSVRSGAGPFWLQYFRTGFKEELASVGLFAVLLVVLQGSKKRAPTSWETKTRWVKGYCHQRGKSVWWGVGACLEFPPWIWMETCSQISYPIMSHAVLAARWTQDQSFAPWAESSQSFGSRELRVESSL